MKIPYKYSLLLAFVFFHTFGQNAVQREKGFVNPKDLSGSGSQGPQSITRNIIEDRKGNIWMASWDGIFRYDGTSFTNITSKITSSRFFSLLQDKKGNLWFGTVGTDGSGLYCYDGKTFKNFTTKDGLLNNEILCIYEDKKGNIWFGVSGGASCYDGKTFRNYITEGNTMAADWIGITFQARRPIGVNSIIEDKKGNFWFATGSNTFVHDGNTFEVLKHGDEPFQNVRTLIKDKNSNVWLAGADGLWRYTNGNLTNFTRQFVGYIIEDSKGNIWTSAENADKLGWALSKYEGNTLNFKMPLSTEISKSTMIFGVLEDSNGNIWFGDVKGVKKYDGKTITDF